MIPRLFAGALMMLLSCAVAFGVDPGLYRLDIEDAQGFPGIPVEVSITLNTQGGEEVDGWSYGVCHVPSMLTLLSVRNGVTAAQIRGGLPPSFNSINEGPGGGTGFTVGVIVDFFGQHALPPGPAHELNVATYRPLGAELSSTPLVFCSTLGQPPVSTLLVVNGQSVIPVNSAGGVAVAKAPPAYTFRAPQQQVAYDPAEGQADFDVLLSIEERTSSATYPTPHQGFTLNLRNDPGVLQPLAVEVVGTPMSLNDGLGPAFVAFNLFDDGVVLGVLYSLFTPLTHTLPAPSPVARVHYQTRPVALVGDLDGRLTRLIWNPAQADPSHANVVVVAGQSWAPDMIDGAVELVAVEIADFVRGDCNADGTVNFADGIWLIAQTTQADAGQGPCAAACDVNGDERLNLADGIYVLMYQFLAGLPPPAPYPACGRVPQSLDCDSFASCDSP